MFTASSLGRTHRAWISIVAFALLTSSSAVQAQSRSERAEEEEWYGWQNLALDGAGLALFSVGVIIESSNPESSGGSLLFGGLGVATFVLGSPIADLAHGNVALAIGSFALRVPAAVMGLWGTFEHALGCELESEEGRSCSTGVGWMVAGAVFAAAAVALDGVLDSETVSRGAASLPIGLAVHEDGALLTLQGAL